MNTTILFPFPANICAQFPQLFIDSVIASFDMVNIADLRVPFCRQSGKDKGCPRPQVCGPHLRARHAFHPFDDGTAAVYLDSRPHPLQFPCMQEAIFKNRFRDDTGALRHRHQTHKLGLHIRRKSGIGHGL